jgi:hypothetical protein
MTYWRSPMMDEREDLLFHKYDLGEVIEHRKAKLNEEVDGFDRNYILNASVDDLCDYLESEYRLSPVLLQKDKIYIKEHGETEVDVRYDVNRFIRDKSKPIYVKGTTITFAIPFEGEKIFFFCQGSAFTSVSPRAHVSETEVIITYNEPKPDPERIRTDFERRVAHIEQYLGYLINDITAFNNGLRASAKALVEVRRARLMKDQGIVAALGYPIKQTEGMPQTYSAPEVKRKVVIQRPPATTAPYTSEPTLDMANYEAILKIISDMVLVMERSPRAFEDMKEEDLRQHFLVQLNGHFEGEATGETFNYEGKTDILIRSRGKNIFIAECMFWRGEKSLVDKIDQLLGYTSWRDTKTAVLIFNRGTDFTTVVSQMPDVVKKHLNFKRQLEYKSETGCRFTLHHKDDKNRELTLTVLAFNIPKKKPL